MPVALAKIDQVIKEEKYALFKPLMEDLVQSSEEEFLDKIDKIQEWDRSKDDLYVWISVLNKMDSILKDIIDKNGLEITSAASKPVTQTQTKKLPISSSSASNEENPSIEINHEQSQQLFSQDSTISNNNSEKINGSTATENHGLKSGASTNDRPEAYLKIISPEDERKITIITGFTYRLLQNTSNRSLYSSLDRMCCLLNCPNLKVKLGAMKVLAISAERIGKLSSPMKPSMANGPTIKKALNIALSLLCSHTNDSNLHYSLNDLMYRFCPKNNISTSEEKKKFPSKWRSLNFKYLSKKTNSIQYFKLTPSQLNSLSLQQIFNKVLTDDDIPESQWFEFSLKVNLAKIFSHNGNKFESKLFYDSQEVFNTISIFLQLKFYSVAYINCLLPSAQVSSKFFEIDSYLFECLNDFILVAMPERKDIISLRDIRYAALFTLECISFKHIWCSDILRNLGGNMSHGALFTVLKNIKKSLSDPKYYDYIDEEFNIRFFILISNMADVKQLNETLTSNGLIQSLLDIISIKNPDAYRSLSSACNLLRVLVSDFETTTLFFNASGYTVLIDRIEHEINFAITHPEFGNPSPYCKVYYSASFRQLSFLRGLLKQVLNLLSLDSSDRIRNLIDSSILKSLNDMLLNRPVFGYTLLAYSLNVVQAMINSEPTVYPILVESETIKIIVENFESYVGPCSELLLVLPHVVSAICLNSDGLQEVLKNNIIKNLFKPFLKVDLVKVITVDETDLEYGTELDELYRHHPAVQDTLVNEFIETLSELRQNINFPKNLIEVNKDGSLFYLDPSETVANMDESAGKLSYFDLQDSSFIIRSFAATLSCCSWKPLSEKLNPIKLWDLVLVENLPFDFTSSDTFIYICDVFSSLDYLDHQSSLNYLLKKLESTLDDLKPFISHKNQDRSFFMSNPIEILQTVASNLSLANAILDALTNVYFDYTTLSFPKVKLILNYFNDENLGMIKKVAEFYSRVILEDQSIRNCLPNQVEADTRDIYSFQKGPIRFHKSKLFADETIKVYERTSAKFTNTYKLRHLSFFIQKSSAAFCKSLLRLSNMRKNDLRGVSRRKEVEIMEHTMKALLENINPEEINIDENLSYYLSIVNTFSFIMVNHSSTSSMSKPRNLLAPIPLSLFYRFDGHKKLFSLLEYLFQNISKDAYKSINSVIQHPVIYDRQNILVVGIINESISFLKKTIQLDSIEDSKNIRFYLGFNLDKEVYTGLFLVNAKYLISENFKTLFSNGMFRSLCQKKKLPDSIFNNLLDFFFSLFSKRYEEKADKSVLCYIESESVNPSKKKCDFLSRFNIPEKDAEILLMENDNELPAANVLDLSEEEHKRYDEALESPDLIKYFPEPMVRDENVVSLSHSSRSEVSDLLKQIGIVKLLSNYPNSAGYAAKLYDSMKHFSDDFSIGSEVLKLLIDELEDNYTKLSLEELAPSIHTFSILLGHYFVPSLFKEEITDRFINLFINDFKPECANEAWFSKYLYGFEGLLAFNIIPKPEELKHPQQLKSDVESRIEISEESKMKIFDCLIKIKHISSTYSALSVARVLLLFSRDYEKSKSITQSGILAVLLKAIGLNQKNEKARVLENVFLLLVRACFETKDVVKTIIENELKKYFGLRDLQKSRVLPALLMEKSNLILRDSSSFIDVICENLRFTDFSDDNQLGAYVLKIKDDASWSKDGPSNTDSKMSLENKTGIVQLLFSQLIAAFKKDWLSENFSDEELEQKKPKSKNDVQSKNPVYAYITFLLRTLTEIVASYKQSKLELLCFSRRNTFGSSEIKPRTAFLNFLLYQLIPLSTDIENRAEFKKREQIAKLAKELVLAFMVSLSRSKPATKDDKYVDPDMTFMRKYTIECILKALSNSVKTLNSNPESFRNVRSWFDLLGHILTIQFTAMFNVSESFSLNNDKFHFCKLMLEMNVPSTITSIMASLDLNYPQSKLLMNHSVEPLKLLSYIRDKYPEHFSEENQDEDEDVDVESDEENYDMFKNSALGMYDVEEVDEDEFDEESLLGDGDDEDIAFVDADGVEEEGIEAVFSDEGDEGMRSRHQDDSEDEDIDLNSEGEVIYENPNILQDVGGESSDDDSDESEIDESDLESDADMISISDLDNEEEAILYEGDGEEDDLAQSEMDIGSDAGDSDDYADLDIDDDDSSIEEINVELYDSQLEHSDWDSGSSELPSESDSDDMRTNFTGGERGEFEEEEDDDGDMVLSELLDGTGRMRDGDHEVRVIRFDELNNMASNLFGSVRNGSISMGDGSNLNVQSLLRPGAQRHRSNTRGNRRFSSSVFENMNLPDDRDLMSEFFLNSANPDNEHPLSGFNSVRRDFDLIARPPNRDYSNRFSSLAGGNNLPALAAFFRDPHAGPGLKNTTARWHEIVEMFYIRKSFSFNIIPAIVNRIYEESLKVHQEESEKLEKVKQEKEAERMKTMKRNYDSMVGSDEEDAIISEDDEEDDDDEESREPVYVQINGQDVDVGTTDIDPEYLNALPEELRAEVFYQHVAEDRARRLSHRDSESHIRPGYLSRLPDNIRSNILEQQVRIQSDPSFIEEVEEESNDVITTNNTRSNSRSEVASIVDASEENTEFTASKKKTKNHFPPLVDRAGIFSILKSIFLPQPYLVREKYHEFFRHLSNSKQNRYDFLNLVLFILIEGIISKSSLDRVYNYICNKANQLKTNSKDSFESHHFQLPLDCTPTTVANQCIDALQILVDHNDSVKLFFVTEHDNLMVHKPISSFANKNATNLENSKNVTSANTHAVSSINPVTGIISENNKKWPINYLFNLLSNRIVTDEVVLMDLLTKILQDCTKMMKNMVKSKKNKLSIPVIDEDLYSLTVEVLNLDSCNTKVFQQVLTIMLNLSILDPKDTKFIDLLIENAKKFVSAVIPELKDLAENVDNLSEPDAATAELITRFSSSTSSQSKLLKVLTSIDFISLAGNKKVLPVEMEQMSKKVELLYSRINLGELWSCLSECLTKFEDKMNLDDEKHKPQVSSVSYLLPLIESLMVVCKYSDISEIKDSLSENDNHISTQHKDDLNKLPLNELFFYFTDSHKKLLNQMIRSNSKLMSGPFSILIKNPRVLDFDNKRYYFMDKLSRDSTTASSSEHHGLEEGGKLSIEVSRDQVFLDSYRSLFFKPIKIFRDCKLAVTFKNEEGVDAGGVKREWYQSISRQMVNPDYALFLSASSDSNTFHPNRTSWVNPEHLSFFKFIGMIIGKSIRDKCFVDCYFSRAVYKQLLGIPVSLKDMESIEPDYYKSLVWILENDITDIIDLTFSVDTDDYGEHKVIDLIENGRDIAVTQENKTEYVTKIVQYKLSTSVEEQMNNLLQGFYSIIPKNLITVFNEKELELLVSGLPDIDVNDWKNNTQYINYTSSSREIGYFWRAVKSFDKEERAKLLQFVTGTSKVPLNGFKELSGVNGISKFAIHKDFGATDRLPQSHTCFNQLDLPSYESYETLRKALLLAINEGHEGFGLA